MSERRASARLELWRAVEAQHVVSTMELVDTVEEQRLVEELLEQSKPVPPIESRKLHYLLSTPFRYPPPPGGSRFRRVIDPGVFYAADEIRTSCAEVGYWRWRFLMDSPSLTALAPKPQTVFRVLVEGRTVDLRQQPFVRRRKEWTDPTDYAACQTFAAAARAQGTAIIRYESVRDPERGGCAAVLTVSAFRRRAPLEEESWYLSVTRDRVRWWSAQRGGPAFEFAMKAWIDNLTPPGS